MVSLGRQLQTPARVLLNTAGSLSDEVWQAIAGMMSGSSARYKKEEPGANDRTKGKAPASNTPLRPTTDN